MTVAHNFDGVRGHRCRLAGANGDSHASEWYYGVTTQSWQGRRERQVLRISVQENGDDLSLVLEGRLVGPWVGELQRVCEDLGATANCGHVTVDLCGVTAMETSAQALLDRLLQRGATLRCSDVMNQYWVEQMARAAKRLPEAFRPCRNESSGGREETTLASS